MKVLFYIAVTYMIGLPVILFVGWNWACINAVMKKDTFPRLIDGNQNDPKEWMDEMEALWLRAEEIRQQNKEGK